MANYLNQEREQQLRQHMQHLKYAYWYFEVLLLLSRLAVILVCIGAYQHEHLLLTALVFAFSYFAFDALFAILGMFASPVLYFLYFNTSILVGLFTLISVLTSIPHRFDFLFFPMVLPGFFPLGRNWFPLQLVLITLAWLLWIATLTTIVLLIRNAHQRNDLMHRCRRVIDVRRARDYSHDPLLAPQHAQSKNRKITNLHKHTLHEKTSETVPQMALEVDDTSLLFVDKTRLDPFEPGHSLKTITETYGEEIDMVLFDENDELH